MFAEFGYFDECENQETMNLMAEISDLKITETSSPFNYFGCSILAAYLVKIIHLISI